MPLKYCIEHQDGTEYVSKELSATDKPWIYESHPTRIGNYEVFLVRAIGQGAGEVIRVTDGAALDGPGLDPDNPPDGAKVIKVDAENPFHYPVYARAYQPATLIVRIVAGEQLNLF